jgi:hypothetical protein
MHNHEPLHPEYMGRNGFVWWQGVVEDIQDPLKLGRVRVRVLGWHTDNKSEIPTDSLPWAAIVMPANSASMSGKGWSPTGILNGTWVMGFFRDGLNAQEPVVFGTLGGIQTVKIPVSDIQANTPFTNEQERRQMVARMVESRKAAVEQAIKDAKNDVGIKPYQMPKNPTIDPRQGFCDPNGVFPLISRMGEADTNRLARGESENTIVSKKRSNLSYCTTALYGFWVEPQTPYAAQYPYNNVYESQAGHVVEYDDTPGAERMHHYHSSGTFTEVHPKGSEVHKVVGNAWDITLNDKMILVKGNASFNADKTLKVKMGKDLEIEVLGDVKMFVNGNMTTEVKGNALHKVGGTYTLASEGNMVIMAPRIDLNPEGNNATQINTFMDRLRGFVNSLVNTMSPSDTTVTSNELPPTPPDLPPAPTREQAEQSSADAFEEDRKALTDKYPGLTRATTDALLAGGYTDEEIKELVEGTRRGTKPLNKLPPQKQLPELDRRDVQMSIRKGEF